MGYFYPLCQSSVNLTVTVECRTSGLTLISDINTWCAQLRVEMLCQHCKFGPLHSLLWMRKVNALLCIHLQTRYWVAVHLLGWRFELDECQSDDKRSSIKVWWRESVHSLSLPNRSLWNDTLSTKDLNTNMRRLLNRWRKCETKAFPGFVLP